MFDLLLSVNIKQYKKNWREWPSELWQRLKGFLLIPPLGA